MSTLLDERFTLAEAAAAAGLTRAQVRHWTGSRHRVELGDATSREPGKWRRFSAFHIFQLAIVGRLALHNIPLKDAQGEAANVLEFLGANGGLIGIGAALGKLQNIALYVVDTGNARFFGLRSYEELAPANVDRALDLKVTNLLYVKLRPIFEEVLRALKLD